MRNRTVLKIRRWNCFISIVGFSCYLGAFLAPYWAIDSRDGRSHFYSLFSTCVKTKGRTACGTVDPNTVDAMFKVSQAFGTLALAFYLATAVFCSLVLLWPRDSRQNLLIRSTITALLTVICFGVCFGLFVAYHWAGTFSVYVGFYVACGSGLPLIVVMIISFILTKVKIVRRKPTNDADIIKYTKTDSVKIDGKTVARKPQTPKQANPSVIRKLRNWQPFKPLRGGENKWFHLREEPVGGNGRQSQLSVINEF